MALLTNPTFWTGAAFVLFFAILFRSRVHKRLASSLDGRSTRIAQELQEARSLREEAEALLRQAKEKTNNADKEVAEILNTAQRDAERHIQDAQVKTEEFLRRRQAAAEARIAQAEAQAQADIRALASQTAIAASETLLRQTLSAQGSDALLSQAVVDLKKHLH
jgi:F-type H+-transporting ATPase subunit b